MHWLNDPEPESWDAIHASPPCQRYSTATPDPAGHPDLEVTRDILNEIGKPWIIENVQGRPLPPWERHCRRRRPASPRHRTSETSFPALTPTCRPRRQEL